MKAEYNYAIKGEKRAMMVKHPFVFDDESQKHLRLLAITFDLEPLDFGYSKVGRDISVDKLASKRVICTTWLIYNYKAFRVKFALSMSFYKSLLAEDPTCCKRIQVRVIALLTPMECLMI